MKTVDALPDCKFGYVGLVRDYDPSAITSPEELDQALNNVDLLRPIEPEEVEDGSTGHVNLLLVFEMPESSTGEVEYSKAYYIRKIKVSHAFERYYGVVIIAADRRSSEIRKFSDGPRDLMETDMLSVRLREVSQIMLTGVADGK